MPTLKDLIKQVVREEMLTLGESLRPGGDHELRGYDPDHRTKALHLQHDLETNESDSDEESEFMLASGETRQFQFVLNNTVAADKAYGINIQTPTTPAGGSFVAIGTKPNGEAFIKGYSSSDFNTSVGRFKSGVLIVIGTIENGDQPGVVKITYGEPEADSGGFGGVNVLSASADDATVELELEADVEASDVTAWLVQAYVEYLNVTDPSVAAGSDVPYLIITYSVQGVGQLYADDRFFSAGGNGSLISTALITVTGPDQILEVDVANGEGFSGNFTCTVKAIRLTGAGASDAYTNASELNTRPSGQGRSYQV